MDILAKRYLGMNNAALRRVPHAQSRGYAGCHKRVQGALHDCNPALTHGCSCNLAKKHALASSSCGLPHEEKALCEVTAAKAELVTKVVADGTPESVANAIVDLYTYILDHNFVLKDDGVYFGTAATNTILGDIAFGQYAGAETKLAEQVSDAGVHDVLRDAYPSLPKPRRSALAALYSEVAKNQRAPSKQALMQDKALLARQIMAKGQVEDSVASALGSKLDNDDLSTVSRVASDVLHELRSFGHVYSSLHAARYPGVYGSKAPGAQVASSAMDLVAGLSASDILEYAAFEAALAAGNDADGAYAIRHQQIKEALSSGESLLDVASSMGFGHVYSSLHGATYPDVFGRVAPGASVAASSSDLAARLKPHEIAKYAELEAAIAAGRVHNKAEMERHAQIKEMLKSQVSQQFGHQHTSLHGASYPSVYQHGAPGANVLSSKTSLSSRLSLEEVARYAKHELDVAAGRVPDPGYVKRHNELRQASSQVSGQSFGHTHTSLHGASYPAVFGTAVPGANVSSSELDLAGGMSVAETRKYAQYEVDRAAGRSVDPAYVKRHAEIKALLGSGQKFGHQYSSLHGAQYPGVYSSVAPGGSVLSSRLSIEKGFSPSEADRYAKYEVDMAAGRVPDPGYVKRHAEIKALLRSGQQFGHQNTSLHGASYPGVFGRRAPGGDVLSSSKDLQGGMSPADLERYAKYEVDLAAGRVPDPLYAQKHAEIKRSLAPGANFGHQHTSLHGASYPGVFSALSPGSSLYSSSKSLTAHMSAAEAQKYAQYEVDLDAGRTPDPRFAQRHAAIKALLQSGQQFGHQYSSLHGARYPGVYGKSAPGGTVVSSTLSLSGRLSLADAEQYARFEIDLANGRVPDPSYVKRHAEIKDAVAKTGGGKSSFGHTWSSLHHAAYPSVYQDVMPYVQSLKPYRGLLERLSPSDREKYNKYESDLKAGRIPPQEYAQQHAAIKAALSAEQQPLEDATSGAGLTFGMMSPAQIAANHTRPKMTDFGTAAVASRSQRQALHFGVPLENIVHGSTVQHSRHMSLDRENNLHTALVNSKSIDVVHKAITKAFGRTIPSSIVRDIATSHINTHTTVAKCIQENPHAANACISSALATRTILLCNTISALAARLKTKLSNDDIEQLATHFSLLYKWA